MRKIEIHVDSVINGKLSAIVSLLTQHPISGLFECEDMLQCGLDRNVFSTITVKYTRGLSEMETRVVTATLNGYWNAVHHMGNMCVWV